jgi:branched-subunit amino acid transport protein
MGDGIPGGLGLILACAALTYASRVAGFSLAGREIPGLFDRFLKMVPVAAFAALAVPDLLTGTAPPARILAAAVCGVLIVKTNKLWLGLLAGMIVFLGLRFAGIW